MGLTAQTTADRASIHSVVDLLFLNADNPELSPEEAARHPGICSVVIARLSDRLRYGRGQLPDRSFRAASDGFYRAVLTAASVEGGGTSFAGMVVFRVTDDEESWRGGVR